MVANAPKSKKRSVASSPSQPEQIVFFTDENLGRHTVPEALRLAMSADRDMLSPSGSFPHAGMGSRQVSVSVVEIAQRGRDHDGIAALTRCRRCVPA